MKEVNRVVSQFKETIFATMTREASKHGAVNLGQGFPDFDGPKWLIELAKRAHDRGSEGKNQYAPATGAPSLRQAIARNYQRFYELEYNMSSEIIVTNGATEAIFSSGLALLNPGDEVILFEPFYDSYVAAIQLSGGVPVPVTLHTPEFNFKIDELEKAFTPKTKLLFVNTPHNPSGKVFTEEELTTIANLAKKHDVIVISDEVYEYLLYDEVVHIPMASLPGMRERTVTISSTGKTFGVTGWKIGWACAPENLAHAIAMVHQFNTFSVHHPAQLAMAEALEKIDSYLPKFKELYKSKRDFFLEGLQPAGWQPRTPKGTYFALCPIPHATGMNDIDYCLHLIREKKVAAIPPSAFYLKSDEGESYIRFCFAKRDETLKAGLDNLGSLP